MTQKPRGQPDKRGGAKPKEVPPLTAHSPRPTTTAGMAAAWDTTSATVKKETFENEIESLKPLSHSGTVLVSASAIDSALQRLLSSKMRTLSDKEEKRIFRSFQHLSPKIDIAYALEVIDGDLYEDLRIIKDIRNEFAHPKDWTDFSTPAIAELVRQFKARDRSCDPFDLFNMRVESCLKRINQKIETALTVNALKKERKR